MALELTMQPPFGIDVQIVQNGFRVVRLIDTQGTIAISFVLDEAGARQVAAALTGSGIVTPTTNNIVEFSRK